MVSVDDNRVKLEVRGIKVSGYPNSSLERVRCFFFVLFVSPIASSLVRVEVRLRGACFDLTWTRSGDERRIGISRCYALATV